MMISDRRPDEVLSAPGAGVTGIPIWLAPQGEWKAALTQLPSAQIAWLDAPVSSDRSQLITRRSSDCIFNSR